MRKYASRHSAGFTLLEVLVSTAIMLVIVLTVVTIASDTLRVYDRAVSDLSTQSEARGALDALENDFSTAIVRSDGRCWMEVAIPGVPGSPAASALYRVGNVPGVDQPIVMLFSSPQDRPRWTSGGKARRPLRGEVCAVAYRLGHRSPFDSPGDPIQRVYGVFRTVIDPENTFTEGLKVINDGTNAAPTSPWNYWNDAARSVFEYAPSGGGAGSSMAVPKQLIDTSNQCWTLDEQNFIASNVVAMNLIFWCSSSLPAAPVGASNLRDPLRRMDSALRPVFAVASDSGRAAGYVQAFEASTSSPTTPAAPLRYAPTGTPTSISMPSLAAIHPHDLFLARLRVYANRIYPDGLPVGGPVSAPPFPYLPYTLRGVEVSLTLLTPDGSKELRGLQLIQGPVVNETDFRRIVYQHGRNYTRYIRVLGNGG